MKAHSTDVFLLSGARTPIGSMGGALSTVPAPKLGAVALRAAMEKAGIAPEHVDEVVMGNVISAGIGQNPARQAAIGAGIPVSAGATTVNKVCGSGLKSVAMAAQSILTGQSSLVAAGGMESMSLAPYLLPKARQGYRMGHGQVLDAMIHDGLWDVYGEQPMGVFGDRCAAKYHFTRREQDDYAESSYLKAQRAVKEGVFADEIVPVEVAAGKKTTLVTADEEPARFDPVKLRELRPAFGSEGTVTAGNASTLSDGAAAVIVASRERCEELGKTPLARIVGLGVHSVEPEWFTIAPIGAIAKLLTELNWEVHDVDLFEVNEAFSVVAMAARKELRIPEERLNPYGGAVALGHPIGCSGTRVLVTLLTGLRRSGGKRGVACLCIGGGEAIAMAVERVE